MVKYIDNKGGKILSDDALKALQACEHPGSWFSIADGGQNIFKNCYAQEGLADRMVDAANTIWQHLEKADKKNSDFKLKIEHYNALIKIIFENGDGSFDAQNIHSNLQTLKIQPDHETYKLMIQKYQKVSSSILL